VALKKLSRMWRWSSGCLVTSNLEGPMTAPGPTTASPSALKSSFAERHALVHSEVPRIGQLHFEDPDDVLQGTEVRSVARIERQSIHRSRRGDEQVREPRAA